MLIKGVQVIDGTGRKPHKADIVISGDRISAIGDLAGRKSDAVIDGHGLYAAPGFINANTDSDHFLTLLSNPSQQSFLEQGITTIIGGQCGVSLAPLLYGDLGLLRMWTHPYQTPVGWNSVKEFLSILQSRGLGVNFGMLAGHATIRHEIVGSDVRDASASEREAMDEVLAGALADGALGASFGLGYYFGLHTPYAEILEFAKPVAREQGICTVHLRNETGGVVDSVREVIRLCEESGARVCISHFRVVAGYEKEYEEAMALLAEAQQRLPLYFDAYPLHTSRVPIVSLIPATLQGESLEEALRLHADMPEKIRAALAPASRTLGNAVIAHAPRNEHLVGKTLKEFAETREVPVADGILELMRLTDLQGTLSIPLPGSERMRSLFTNPRVIIATNTASFRTPQPLETEHTLPCAFHFLEAMPLEQIVHRMTGLPAEAYGIPQRGRLVEGDFADIVLFSAMEGGGRAPITIRHVILNGKHVVRGGAYNAATPAGRILTRSGK